MKRHYRAEYTGTHAHTPPSTGAGRLAPSSGWGGQRLPEPDPSSRAGAGLFRGARVFPCKRLSVCPRCPVLCQLPRAGPKPIAVLWLDGFCFSFGFS